MASGFSSPSNSKEIKNKLPTTNSDVDFRRQRIEMSRFSLFFRIEGKGANKVNRYESSFRLETYLKYKKITRICIIGLIFSAMSLILIDPLYSGFNWNSDEYMYRNIIRFVFLVPISLLWYLYTRKYGVDSSSGKKKNAYWQRHDRHMLQYNSFIKLRHEQIASIASFLIGLCILMQTIISRTPDQEVYMLYFFMVYLFFGIPFAFACIITWGLTILFIICMWAVLSNDPYSIRTLQLSVMYLCMINALLTIAAHSVERNNRKEYILTLDLEKEDTIVNKLLSNLLPSTVMDRLKQGQNTICDESKQCSILFSDLVSFTKWASQLQAEDLIRRLHEMYSRFDNLCDVYGVYKVETIGDAYFVSSGFPMEFTIDHADRLMRLGKNMMIDCQTFDWDGYTPCMRIGIHSGPVMAGVVGRKMPRYHLFGKTVMIANELETTGVPQQIHISETAKNNLTGQYHLEKRPETIVFMGEAMVTYLWKPENTYDHVVNSNNKP